MNWLITGGCGFIGRALAATILADSGHSVRVLDNLSVGTRDDLAHVAPFVELDRDAQTDDWSAPLALLEGDILDRDTVLRAVAGADVVVHLAANTGVGPSVADPEADCRTNVLGTLNLLQSSHANEVRRFVFASSGAPLGVQVPPLHEEMAPHPASPYGASKLAGEGYCSAYFHCFGVETVALRFGNVYGEGSGHKQSVVAKFIKQAMAGERLEIYGDGKQTRDFIHISDLVRAIRCAAEVPGVGGETFQVATAQETTVSEMTETLMGVMRDEGATVPEIFHGETRTGDVARNYSDTSKARERLGWQPEVALSEGLRRTVRHFLAKQTD
ncbi:NAD-dependent epimerase/dehydratase family protein [Arhodomonas aquaeolei]|uniref:NAD-dependent epimerase/dehydratase family protein n=1 Tax=Arhodomonas aquaeolei TaxID=2369 RepID=UPI000363F161|nr:NAD-dependent epimerase/dehydratase family protein [Arhodomonas aquaeolei]